MNSSRYAIVDTANWPRAAHCEAFRKCVNPRWGVTFDLDVSNFLEAVRKADLSFTLSLIWTVSRVANGIEEFRYRFLNGEPVLYDQIDPSFTYLRTGEELFRVVRVPMRSSLIGFIETAQRCIAQQTGFFPAGGREQDVFQFSALPWIKFTQISHTVSADPDSAAPIFDWGKYSAATQEGRYVMPFSVDVHHSFVDGIHVGRFVERLSDIVRNPRFVDYTDGAK